MKILTSSAVTGLARLLNLFPLEALNDSWPGADGSKDDRLLEIAGTRDFAKICRFMLDSVPRCHQHAHLLEFGGKIKDLPRTVIPDTNPLISLSAGRSRRDLYIIETHYIVHLTDPYEKITVPYMWPFVVEFDGKNCRIRFVKLERSLSSSFTGRHLKTEPRSDSESSIVGSMALALEKIGGVRSLDFNKGIKSMVKDDIADPRDVQVKQTTHTASTYMDLDYNLKKDAPALYASQFVNSPLLRTKLELAMDDVDLKYIICNPSEGTINFPRYTALGETEAVIKEILVRN